MRRDGLRKMLLNLWQRLPHVVVMTLEDVGDESNRVVGSGFVYRWIECFDFRNHALNIDAALLARIGEAEGATATEIEVVFVQDRSRPKIVPDNFYEGGRFQWCAGHSVPPWGGDYGVGVLPPMTHVIRATIREMSSQEVEEAIRRTSMFRRLSETTGSTSPAYRG